MEVNGKQNRILWIFYVLRVKGAAVVTPLHATSAVVGSIPSPDPHVGKLAVDLLKVGSSQ